MNDIRLFLKRELQNKLKSVLCVSMGFQSLLEFLNIAIYL
jgi:hypothetical protein